MSARITRHTAKRLKTEEASSINPLINNGSDILICIAPYLSIEELVNLSLTNRHFGLSTGDDQLSLMEDVVRQVIIKNRLSMKQLYSPNTKMRVIYSFTINIKCYVNHYSLISEWVRIFSTLLMMMKRKIRRGYLLDDDRLITQQRRLLVIISCVLVNIMLNSPLSHSPVTHVWV